MSDDDVFQLPVAGLFADLEAGSGSVRVDDDFTQSDVVSQLQILQDWLTGLSSVRAAALEQLFWSRFAILPLDRAEQLKRFERCCMERSIACPQQTIDRLAAA